MDSKWLIHPTFKQKKAQHSNPLLTMLCLKEWFSFGEPLFRSRSPPTLVYDINYICFCQVLKTSKEPTLRYAQGPPSEGFNYANCFRFLSSFLSWILCSSLQPSEGSRSWQKPAFPQVLWPTRWCSLNEFNYLKKYSLYKNKNIR